MPKDVAAAWRRPRGALESSRIVQHARKPHAKPNRQESIGTRHCEERSDEAIQGPPVTRKIASPRSQ